MTATGLWGVSVRRLLAVQPQPHRSPLLPTQTVDDFQIMPPRPRWFRFSCRSSTAASAAGCWLLVSNLLHIIVSVYASVDTRLSRNAIGLARFAYSQSGFVYNAWTLFMRDREREREAGSGTESKWETKSEHRPLWESFLCWLTYKIDPPPPERPQICIIIVISLNGAAR